MKHLMALLAMFLAMPMFADGNDIGDSDDDELTNEETQDDTLSSIANLITSLDSKVTSLQMALGTAQSAITALQGVATRNEVAIVMVVPDDRRCDGPAAGLRKCYARTFLMGSTIPGFPQGTVNSETYEFADSSLPGGTYLVELQQPHSGNPLCHGTVTAVLQINRQATERLSQCPRFRVFGGKWRMDNGSRVYAVASRSANLNPDYRFPSVVPFTAEAPAGSYAGTIKITRLKP